LIHRSLWGMGTMNSSGWRVRWALVKPSIQGFFILLGFIALGST
jgi:hypothetical protein